MYKVFLMAFKDISTSTVVNETPLWKRGCVYSERNLWSVPTYFFVTSCHPENFYGDNSFYFKRRWIHRMKSQWMDYGMHQHPAWQAHTFPAQTLMPFRICSESQVEFVLWPMERKNIIADCVQKALGIFPAIVLCNPYVNSTLYWKYRMRPFPPPPAEFLVILILIVLSLLSISCLAVALELLLKILICLRISS